MVEPSRPVLLRDLFVFSLKLWLDGLKDLVLLPLAFGTAVVGLVLRRPRLFYALLRKGEQFDRWLNLFGAAQRAGRSRDGLFAGSEPDDGTLLGRLESVLEPAPPAPRTGGIPPRS